MKLTSWTDYSLRVLMYCAASQGREQPVTITEIAEAHNISRSHLTKIVVALSDQGLLETTRGRGGGLRLHSMLSRRISLTRSSRRLQRVLVGLVSLHAGSRS